MYLKRYSAVFVLALLLLANASTILAQGRRGERPAASPRPAGAAMPAYRFEITPFWGYQMGGKTYYSGGDVNIVDSQVYGIHLGSPTPIGATVEFFYSHQPTSLEAVVAPPFEPSYTKTLFDFNVDYYMLGVLRPLQPGATQTFGAVYLGAANMKPQESGYTDEWLFAAGLGGGVKARLSPKVGLRIQGRLLIPMQFSGGGLWCGTGGCDVGVGASSTILQFDLNAGLVIYL